MKCQRSRVSEEEKWRKIEGALEKRDISRLEDIRKIIY
jgi:hypothetical protein